MKLIWMIKSALIQDISRISILDLITFRLVDMQSMWLNTFIYIICVVYSKKLDLQAQLALSQQPGYGVITSLQYVAIINKKSEHLFVLSV